MFAKKKTILLTALGIAVVAGVSFWGCSSRCCKKTVIGVGYVRGAGMSTLKNKYAGFISKVNYKTGEKVKKGDIILEYDDLDWRMQLELARDAVIEQEKTVALKKLALQLKQINPVPSEYRNMINRYHAAQAKASRLQHEREVYEKLYAKRIISDLSYRAKTQASMDADFDERSRAHDIEIVRSGLEPLYIEIAQKELESAETRLADLKRELALVEEEGRYYKIVASDDGIVETNSDTLCEYDAAGSSAAEVHIFTKGTKVICYLDERDVHHVTIGMKYRFRSNLFDCDQKGFPIVQPYKVKKDHTSFGDRSLYKVECMLVSSPEPLPLNSTGQMEIDVSCGK